MSSSRQVKRNGTRQSAQVDVRTSQKIFLSGRRRTPRIGSTVKMSNPERQDMEDNIQKVMDSLKLLPVPDIDPNLPRLRGRAIEANSLKAYEKHYRGWYTNLMTVYTHDNNYNTDPGIERFLALIGDYESLVILQRNAPQLAPAMNINSLTCYIDFKTYEKGNPSNYNPFNCV